MTVAELRKFLDAIAGNDDGEMGVFVEWQHKKTDGYMVHEIETVRLELDCSDSGNSPTLVFRPDQTI